MAIGVEEAAGNIVEYHDGLTEITDNIQDIRDRAASVIDTLSVVDDALAKAQSIRDQVASFGDDVDKLQLVFKLMGKAGPLKGVAKAGDLMLARVEAVTEKVERSIDRLVAKIENSGIKTSLDRAIENVERVDAALADGQSRVVGQRDSFQGVAEIAAKAYVFAEAPIVALGTVIDGPAAAVTEINRTYDAIVRAIGAFERDLPSGEFEALLGIEADLRAIFDVLDDISGPLDVVYGIIKPIEPLLNAVGLITKFTVDPVIDYVLDVLQIDKVIDVASAKITSFLPDVDVIEDIIAKIDVARIDIDGISVDFGTFDDDRDEAVDADGRPLGDDVPRPGGGGLPTSRISDPFGIGAWVVEEIEARLIQTAVAVGEGFLRERIGSLDAQGLAVFVEIPKPLKGSDDDDDLTAEVAGVRIDDVILVGDDAANTITAFDGDNMIYGAGGDDTIYGEGAGAAGTGLDTAVFTGPLGQYTFSWAEPGKPYSDLTMEHVSPLPGVSFDGTDLLIGIERVTFLGTRRADADGTLVALTLTMEQLQSFVRFADTDVAVGPPADPDNPDPAFVFANYGSRATGIAITGNLGDDLLVGGLAGDSITGGAGNDTLQGGGGVDTLDGGTGRDAYAVTSGETWAVVDLGSGRAQTFTGTVGATNDVALRRIEDAQAEVSGGAALFGTDAASGNALTGGNGDDAIHGRSGADTLNGAEGNDTLVGGFGLDRFDGGDGDDHIVATDAAVGWTSGERIDGGDGFDTAYYTTAVGVDKGTPDGRDARHFAPLSDAEFPAWPDRAGGTKVITEMREQIVSTGWIDLRGKDEVRRMSDRDAPGGAQVLAIDRLEHIEAVVGTNQADLLRGGRGADALHAVYGAGGDDTILAEDASGVVSGDGGRDRIVVTARLRERSSGDEDTVPAATREILGDGEDTLDLSRDGDVRWRLRYEDLGRLAAFDADNDVDLFAATPATYRQDIVRDFGRVVLGGNDDAVRYAPLARDAFETTIAMGAGRDVLELGLGLSAEGTLIGLGQAGDDRIEVTQGSRGGGDIVADGGTGDDHLIVDGRNATLRGGAGDDTIDYDTINGTGVSLEGGDGVDVLRITGTQDAFLDLGEGTLRVNSLSIPAASVSGFEVASGTTGEDDMRGGAIGEKLVSGAGSDTLHGGDLTGLSTRAPTALTPGGGLFLEVGGDHSAALAGGWTVEAWVSTTSDDAGFQRLVTAKAGTGTQAFSLALKDGEAHLRVDTDGSGPSSCRRARSPTARVTISSAATTRIR